MENAGIFFENSLQTTIHNGFLLYSLEVMELFRVVIIVPKIDEKEMKRKFKLVFSRAKKTIFPPYSISFPPKSLFSKSPVTNYKTAEFTFNSKDKMYFYTHISFDLDIFCDAFVDRFDLKSFFLLSIKSNSKLYPKMLVQFERPPHFQNLLLPRPKLEQVNYFEIFSLLQRLGYSKTTLIIYCETVKQRNTNFNVPLIKTIKELHEKQYMVDSMLQQTAQQLAYTDDAIAETLATDPCFNLYVIDSGVDSGSEKLTWYTCFDHFFSWVVTTFPNVTSAALSKFTKDTQRDALSFYASFNNWFHIVNRASKDGFVVLSTHTKPSIFSL